MEDNSHPLLVATNGSLRFKWMQSFRPQVRLPSSPLRVGKQLWYDRGNDCSAGLSRHSTEHDLIFHDTTDTDAAMINQRIQLAQGTYYPRP